MHARFLASSFILLSLFACGGAGSPGGGAGGSGGGGGGLDLTGATGGGGGGGAMVAAKCGELKPVASGKVHTTVTDITVRSNAVVSTSLRHKLDIDPVEDGCVSTFTFSIRLHPQGCDLSGQFTTSAGDNVAHLDYLGLKADSFCENFLDKVEGEYNVFNTTIGGKAESMAAVAIWVGGLPSDVPGDQQKTACMQGMTLTFPDADIHLIDGSKTLTVNLKDLVIQGDLRSAGDTGEACPAKVGCPAPGHNGGALTCYGTTYCADGYTFANNACSK